MRNRRSALSVPKRPRRAIGMVLPDRHAPRETGVLAKAASGALESVPVARVTNLARALIQLKAAGLWAVGLDGSGEMALPLGNAMKYYDTRARDWELQMLIKVIPNWLWS